MVSFDVHQSVSKAWIHHLVTYSCPTLVLDPSEQKMPVVRNMEVIRRLQERVAPEIFTPRCVYDGRKNLYATRNLPFTDDRAEVRVL